MREFEVEVTIREPDRFDGNSSTATARITIIEDGMLCKLLYKHVTLQEMMDFLRKIAIQYGENYPVLFPALVQ